MIKRKAGRITAAGLTKEVTFTPATDNAITLRVDAAYHEKYATSPLHCLHDCPPQPPRPPSK